MFPCRLGERRIACTIEVWALDITYIPVARGRVYLLTVLDWYSGRVLAHRVATTMEAEFCMEAINDAIARYRAPGIFNTDQSSQFSSADFVKSVKDCGVRRSMGGRGCSHDHGFVKRRWRSVKYEEAYLRACDSVAAVRSGIARYLEFYNARRPHRAHDGRVIDVLCFAMLAPQRQAA